MALHNKVDILGEELNITPRPAAKPAAPVAPAPQPQAAAPVAQPAPVEQPAAPAPAAQPAGNGKPTPISTSRCNP